MERKRILLNRKLNSEGSEINSDLSLVNGQFINKRSSEGVVNEHNVRGFLDDENNADIISSFFTFLTANTSVQEFKEIYYSDKKLSETFNKFYSENIQQSVTPSTSVIDENLSGVTKRTINNNNFNWDGSARSYSLTGIPNSIINASRKDEQEEELMPTTDEDSYYVPIHLNLNRSLMSEREFQICKNRKEDIVTSGKTDGVDNTILNCFVDINLNSDISSFREKGKLKIIQENAKNNILIDDINIGDV